MDPRLLSHAMLNRRMFLGQSGVGLGSIALSQLLAGNLRADDAPVRNKIGGMVGLPHFAPKAKRVIYLFQGGGPSQMELFDYRSEERRVGKECRL